MPAYWMARAQIFKPEEYKKYTDLVPAILSAHGGKVHCRGGDYKVLEGETAYERFIVVEFPTLDAAEACFNSAAYQEAAAFRRQPGVARNELVIVEGGDATPR